MLDTHNGLLYSSKNQQNTVWNNMGKSRKWNKKKKANIKECLLYDFVFITYNTGKVL